VRFSRLAATSAADLNGTWRNVQSPRMVALWEDDAASEELHMMEGRGSDVGTPSPHFMLMHCIISLIRVGFPLMLVKEGWVS